MDNYIEMYLVLFCDLTHVIDQLYTCKIKYIPYLTTIG